MMKCYVWLGGWYDDKWIFFGLWDIWCCLKKVCIVDFWGWVLYYDIF